MILSAPIDHVITLSTITLEAARWGATKKTAIGNTDNRRLTNLVNSGSTAPPIGLPPKGAKFFQTSKDC
jgi:hypothetical protein